MTCDTYPLDQELQELMLKYVQLDVCPRCLYNMVVKHAIILDVMTNGDEPEDAIEKLKAFGFKGAELDLGVYLEMSNRAPPTQEEIAELIKKFDPTKGEPN